MTTTKQSGFTLVELAIVMTIIGLLIGGILKGQELLENARATSTIAQVKSFDAAISAFRDIYDGLPGDLKDADKRIPGCSANCTHTILASPSFTVGDGLIGQNTFIEEAAYMGTLTSPISSIHQEDALLWLQLLKANLITGVSDIMLQTGTPQPEWGVTHPAAKIGGGFHAGSEEEEMACCGMPSQTKLESVSGALLIGIGPNAAEQAFQDSNGNPMGVMVPVRAEQIDRKMDDGNPAAGSVFAVGPEECYAGSAGDFSYNASSSAKSCNLVFALQK